MTLRTGVMWNNPLPASSRIGVLPHITVSRETRMTHAVRIVAVVAVLIALAVGVPVQAQTPEIEALRVRASGAGVPRAGAGK